MTEYPSFDFEKQAIKKYGAPVGGVDEAGRGPWAGPVVAAAVILDETNYPDGLNDSKKLSAQKRDLLFKEICEKAIVGIGIADVARIDEMNILHASLWAMSEAVKDLSQVPNVLLIDGNKAPKIDCPCELIVKGDSKSCSIAAASIIAKVTRDRILETLALEYPDYGWETNKGYGTKDHRDGIARVGVCEHHRRSYKPIQQALKNIA